MNKGFILTSLIVITTVGLIAVAGAVYLIADSFQLTSTASLSEEVLRLSESGTEEAGLRLLRNPSYLGETFTVNNTAVSVTVSGSGPKTLLSTASKYGIIKQSQVIKP